MPRKTCNYSCVYCQLGRTARLTPAPEVFYPTEEVVDAVARAVAEHGNDIDYVTFMGDGEPTLASNLGEMVEGVQATWDGRTALITNGSLLHMPAVREAAGKFDVVSPTVSAGDERTFRMLHHPSRSLCLALVVDGMRKFREEYICEIWAEVMLVKGVNDSVTSMLAIRDVLEYLDADKVFLNVPTRPPAKKGASPPSREIVERFLEMVPQAIDMTAPESGEFIMGGGGPEHALLQIAANHPLREDQALGALAGTMDVARAKETLDKMVGEGSLERACQSGTVFYRVPAKRHGTP